MAEIVLVRQQNIELTEAEKLAARKAMFGVVDGLGEKGQKQWRRFWNLLMRLEAGELVYLRTHQERLGWFHRKHMSMEAKIFEAQERFETFDAFRTWLKVGSGFVEWYPGPKGGVIPVPKSISYAKLEQADMEEFHSNAVQFFRTSHAQKTLWPHLSANAAMEMMETILMGFNE